MQDSAKQLQLQGGAAGGSGSDGGEENSGEDGDGDAGLLVSLEALLVDEDAEEDGDDAGGLGQTGSYGDGDERHGKGVADPADIVCEACGQDEGPIAHDIARGLAQPPRAKEDQEGDEGHGAILNECRHQRIRHARSPAQEEVRYAHEGGADEAEIDPLLDQMLHGKDAPAERDQEEADDQGDDETELERRDAIAEDSEGQDRCRRDLEGHHRLHGRDLAALERFDLKDSRGREEYGRSYQYLHVAGIGDQRRQRPVHKWQENDRHKEGHHEQRLPIAQPSRRLLDQKVAYAPREHGDDRYTYGDAGEGGHIWCHILSHENKKAALQLRKTAETRSDTTFSNRSARQSVEDRLDDAPQREPAKEHRRPVQRGEERGIREGDDVPPGHVPASGSPAAQWPERREELPAHECVHAAVQVDVLEEDHIALEAYSVGVVAPTEHLPDEPADAGCPPPREPLASGAGFGQAQEVLPIQVVHDDEDQGRHP